MAKTSPVRRRTLAVALAASAFGVGTLASPALAQQAEHPHGGENHAGGNHGDGNHGEGPGGGHPPAGHVSVPGGQQGRPNGMPGNARGPEFRGPEVRGPEARGPERRGPEHWDGDRRGPAPGFRGGPAFEHGRAWDGGWRRESRYDWQGWREVHRDRFRMGYYAPPIPRYRYSRIGIGFFLGPVFFGERYWIGDPWAYRLPPAYGPYRWVRYFNDALLVDVTNGRVVDVIYGIFW